MEETSDQHGKWQMSLITRQMWNAKELLVVCPQIFEKVNEDKHKPHGEYHLRWQFLHSFNGNYEIEQARITNEWTI